MTTDGSVTPRRSRCLIARNEARKGLRVARVRGHPRRLRDGRPPDPAQFASATTLSDAIARASSAYGVPREVLVAIAWTETRFGDPSAHDDQGSSREGDGAHKAHGGDVGPLGLRGSTVGARSVSVDTLSRAQALLASADRETLSHNVGLGVAGAAAVLSESRTTDRRERR